MLTLSPHEQIRLKVTAYLFNNRADALRGELYRAMCLFALKNSPVPMGYEEITLCVASYLKSSDNSKQVLHTIVLDELNNLIEVGQVKLQDDKYIVCEDCSSELFKSNQNELLSSIKDEVCRIATNINPRLLPDELENLFSFFIEVANIVSSYQLPFISRGQGTKHITDANQELSVMISERRISYGVDLFIDVDRFLRDVVVFPSEILSDFLAKLYQVSVITQLLAWDPSLEYLQNKVLAGKVLYLDSSIIFALVLKSHPLNKFLSSLIKTSHKELGVQFKVHTITIGEYNRVVNWYDSQFPSMERTLRQTAINCKREGQNPADYFEGSIFVDYLINNLDHVDLGSWRRYINGIKETNIKGLLKEHGVYSDDSFIKAPEDQLWKVQESLKRASMIQVERRKRSQIKTDLKHDALIYYLIDSTRKKSNGDDLSLGFDKYLITLDGSLIYFLRDYGVTWTETFFLFPDQWYELTFPFLRIKLENQSELSKTITSLAFSPAFPHLTNLVPLELCRYIFELGGKDLHLGSVQSVVQSLLEAKLVEQLDPGNKDKRKRDEAELRVQRMIAEETLKKNKKIESLEVQAASLAEETQQMEDSLKELSSKRTQIESDLQKQEAIRKKFGGTNAQIEAIRSIYIEDIDRLNDNIKELNERYDAEIKRTTEQSEAQLREKTIQIQNQERLIEQLNNNLASLGDEIKMLNEFIRKEKEEQEAEKQRLKQEREKQIRTIRRVIISIMMILGTLASVYALSPHNNFGVTLGALGLFMTGIVLYLTLKSVWYAFIAYGIGLILSVGFLLSQNNLQTAQWIIPMAWEVTILGLDRWLSRIR